MNFELLWPLWDGVLATAAIFPKHGWAQASGNTTG